MTCIFLLIIYFISFECKPTKKKAYFLTFIEVNEDDNYTFVIDKFIKNAKALASNSNIVYNTEGAKINVIFDKKRSYALIELEF